MAAQIVRHLSRTLLDPARLIAISQTDLATFVAEASRVYEQPSQGQLWDRLNEHTQAPIEPAPRRG
jgi:hypothetical protein